MQPQVSSYNLATSVAMTLYHWMSGRPPHEAGGGDGTDDEYRGDLEA